ncbi:MAG: hypothetical protein F6K36_18190 [Symploca sp. SIO3C6]|uniref:ClpX-type ZB domain-containing protein n=1 Tax=Symploca sp. SIO1C4 TaxID=2607765 RepID=A0A6B3NE64_9CYAN|nr:hypothetical protein [Symploca sp. SIO3C6]NER28912.1 hypothetical protein [Symploca sp. SIO1C4]
MTSDKYHTLLRCSFCKKNQEQVRKLIVGPKVSICDECVDLCKEILAEESQPVWDRKDKLFWFLLISVAAFFLTLVL